MRIAFLGTYLPRRCGIGTFTADLYAAISGLSQRPSCRVLALNDTSRGYSYSKEVAFEIDQDDLGSYLRAADFLNSGNFDVLSLQHEYGIFGGPEGSHVLELIHNTNIPIVTTLHTIPRQPIPLRRQVLVELARCSRALVTMTPLGRSYLTGTYQIPKSRIAYIPHGVPDVPFTGPDGFKARFGAQDRFILMTFGLLGSNKGIEHVIGAMPRIVEAFPRVLYWVIGETAKFWLDREGESYRERLQNQVRELGVKENVVFHNGFLSHHDLIDRLAAADAYITPYNGEDQIVSGTLSYAVGMGKATISTPYLYARELLSHGRGVLVPFADPQAIAEQVIGLIRDEVYRTSMRRKAYLFGRQMIWPVVARSYYKLFDRAYRKKSRNYELGIMNSRQLG